MKPGDGLGVAGVRLAGGRQVFVEGAPPDLAHGTQVVINSEDQELPGTVSIAPSLIMWRDPEAMLGSFLRIVPSAAPDPLPTAEPPLAQFLADENAPSPARLNDMIQLARAETSRLDD